MPSPTQRLGFTTRDDGAAHVNQGATLEFDSCPPTSGEHINIQGAGPLARQFYGPEREANPGGWVHNLEHGYVVGLYSCAGGCPSSAELDEMRRFFTEAPGTALSTQCGTPNRVLVARFDGMSSRYALLAWDRALLLDTFDLQTALTFAQQWQDPPQRPEQNAC